MRTKYILFGLFILAIYFDSLSQSIVRGPYLQNPTPNEITIRWRTDSATITASTVVYGTSISALNGTATDTAKTINHTVTIKNLLPNTYYYYRVGNGSQFFNTASEEYKFKTFPIANSVAPARIWALGDFGKGSVKQRQVRDAFVNYDTNKETDLWIWLGDNAYGDGKDEEYQKNVFDSVYGYEKIMHYLPFHPAPGNHDYNSFSPIFNTQDPNAQTGTYLDIIDVPMNAENGGVASNTKLFYSFNYGDIHFVSFNSELASLNNPAHDWLGVNVASNFATSPMKLWLEADLQANTKRWTIVYFHQPPHSAGSHNSASALEVQMKAIREKWCPILEQYGVDIVINGHSHVYERSYLMSGFFGNWNTLDSTMILQKGTGSLASGTPYRKYFNGPNGKKGTVYMVSGNGGSSETNPPLNHPIMVAKDGCDDCVGSTIFDISNDTLTARYLKYDGSIPDEFTIIKTDFPLDVKQIDKFKDAIFTVYPNPTAASITIESNMKENYTIYVQDVVGRKVWDKKVGASQNMKETINLKELGFQTGSYLVSMCKEDGNCKTQKVTLK